MGGRLMVNVDNLPNSIDRRSHRIVDALEDQANRMVAAMDEPPPGMKEPDPASVRRMWAFSMYPNPEQTFWALHDTVLPGLLAQIAMQPMDGAERLKAIRGAHQQAELQALTKVWPQRAKLVMLGITTIDRSVKLAEHAARLAGQEDKQPEMNPVQEAATY